MIPLYDLEPRNVLNTLSKYFKNEKRRFYVGSTHNVEKRKKQHLGVFNSGEMQVEYITEDREKCLSIESTLINALKINKCSPVNKQKKSKIPKENYKEYYVYIIFNDEKIMKSSKKIESGSLKKKIDLPDTEYKFFFFMDQGRKEADVDLDSTIHLTGKKPQSPAIAARIAKLPGSTFRQVKNMVWIDNKGRTQKYTVSHFKYDLSQGTIATTPQI